MKKLVWQKPKIVVLTKGTSQEAVLWFCKNTSFPGGSATAQSGIECTTTNPILDPPGACTACREQGQSGGAASAS